MGSDNAYGNLAPRRGFILSGPLVYLTIFALFSESIFFKYDIDIKFFYVVVFIGSVAVLTRWDFRLNKYHMLALLYLSGTGLASVMAGTNTLRFYLQQLFGIGLCSTYFYLFLRNQPRSLTQVFELYARCAYYVCWIGLLITPIASLLTSRYQPVQSIMTEPEHFATVVFPGAFYYAWNAIHRKKDIKEAIVMLIAIVLSGSATAFLGLLLALMLLLKNRSVALALGLALGCIFGLVAYAFDEHTRIRVDDSLKAIVAMDVTGVNLSTYGLISNLYVTTRVLSEHPWFGIGIGAHRLAHEQYIGDLPGASSSEMIDLNALDGSSLLLRAGSELGLVGACLIFVFIARFYVRGNSEYAVLSNAILVYFALKLFREGHWFPPETYFFVWTYVFAWMRQRQSALAGTIPKGVQA